MKKKYGVITEEDSSKSDGRKWSSLNDYHVVF
jgi:hypothetical protein